MSTKTRPEELIQQALDGELVPLGEYVLRADKNGAKTTYPKRAQELNNIEAGDGMMKWVDQESGATVTIPVDYVDE